MSFKELDFPTVPAFSYCYVSDVICGWIIVPRLRVVRVGLVMLSTDDLTDNLDPSIELKIILGEKEVKNTFGACEVDWF